MAVLFLKWSDQTASGAARRRPHAPQHSHSARWRSSRHHQCVDEPGGAVLGAKSMTLIGRPPERRPHRLCPQPPRGFHEERVWVMRAEPARAQLHFRSSCQALHTTPHRQRNGQGRHLTWNATQLSGPSLAARRTGCVRLPSKGGADLPTSKSRRKDPPGALWMDAAPPRYRHQMLATLQTSGPNDD